jgi:hypothetical protein
MRFLLVDRSGCIDGLNIKGGDRAMATGTLGVAVGSMDGWLLIILSFDDNMGVFDL